MTVWLKAKLVSLHTGVISFMCVVTKNESH